MYRIFYLLAALAALIGWLDVADAPQGSRAQLEGGFLFLSVPVLIVAGFIAGRITMKACPSCKERIKKNAIICKHCKSAI
ncbi:hypothetical protein YA0783_23005 [Pseudomonas corrugata]|uniref:hypothetical protein n=1 Tax=Pseudomonas corrugata TaxID=47879 RepID=UPI0018E5FA14|nr:hypothetical protein [Pseudomonas corrugata]MBI6621172.1 hypothetical protein [Pseudomonas corrugata]MBI6693738.1 hypothetical protein [Pseudomonas corrugata]